VSANQDTDLLEMKAQDFFHHLERGNLLPLYYFYGTERGLIDEALDRVEEKAIAPPTRDFNLKIFHAKEDPEETILDSLQVFPVRSPRTLIVIHQADSISRKESSPYTGYFSNPNPLTCLVFVGEKVDLRTKFFQALEKKGAAVAFYPLYEKDLIRWIYSQAEQLGYRLSPEAVSVLVERVGTDTKELKPELQKLALRPDGNRLRGEEDVLALTGDIRIENPFELPLAVGHLNLGDMLHLLRKNLQQGEPPLFLFSLIVRQLRLLRRAQELLAGGSSRKEIEARLRILPRRANDFWEQAEKFPISVLQQLWPPTLKTDQELKSSRSDKGLLLGKYLWTLHLLAGNRVRRPEGK
jgi:DNA polymerase-3 subunit delta